MDENTNDKPFDTVSIVLLVIIAGGSDVADAVTLLIAAVPVIGQIAYLGNAFLISPIVWATIQLWFIIKLRSFGVSGLLNLAGGIGNIIGIPASQTVTVAIAIFLANNPEAKKIAGVATGKIAKAK